MELQESKPDCCSNENIEASPKLTILDCLKIYYKKAFKFKDTSGRKEYAVGMIYQWIVMIIFNNVLLGLYKLNPKSFYDSSFMSDVVWGIQWLIWGIVCIPSFALNFRRSKDISGSNATAWILYISAVFSGIAYTVMISGVGGLMGSTAEIIYKSSILIAFLTMITAFYCFSVLLFSKSKHILKKH